MGRTVTRRSYAGQHEVTVIERVPCTIRADREGLEQALVHLLQNAIEASDLGTPVFLHLWRDDVQAVLEIIDSGCGMSAEFLRTRLFKPFHSS